MLRGVIMVGALGGCLAAACGEGSSSPDTRGGSEQLFIGSVDGSDARIAFVRDGAHWAAYVCGGANSVASLTRWFQGTVASSEPADVTAESEDETLSATFAGEVVSGTLTKAGTEAGTFDASRVSADVPAGLFQTVSSGCRTGLIVPPAVDGDPQGVYCANLTPPAERVYEQVTPISPMNLRSDVVRARVLDSEGRILELVRVSLPLDSY